MASSNMKLFDLDSKLSFNDVLDNLALYYVIRNEYTSLSLKNKPAVEAVEEEKKDKVKDNKEKVPEEFKLE